VGAQALLGDGRSPRSTRRRPKPTPFETLTTTLRTLSRLLTKSDPSQPFLLPHSVFTQVPRSREFSEHSL
jgi:hypothetical protein